MKLLSVASMAAALGCALLLTTPSVNAEPLHKSNHRHAVVHTHRVVNKVVVARPAPILSVTTMSAYNLNRLPAGYVRFLHNDDTFYYSEGVYYKKKPHGFVLVKPRAGFRVASLPSGYRIVRSGGATFYSFNNVRYRKINGFFVVV
ncbi:MAG: hypothetical protein COB20_06500 [SAR86 cluster bacterium]|uniref:Uncharacterized protein n=1 Tax=SAR86 cluster bacterium TaxID=2030880 RepID=A0A2A4X922_9GAMM|nr:MAG: hypothetical protein COB20_06500 [SAR86 cluster bacterium]